MNRFNMLSLTRLLLLSAALCSITPSISTAADEKPAGQLAFTVNPPAGKPASEVAEVLKTASAKRGWTVKESSNDRVVLYLNHRRNEATVTFLITPSGVQAYCEGYETNKGVRGKPEQPTGWLRNLHADIALALGLPKPPR